MILMFGPAGSGKSLQGRILAIRHDWKWMSVGAILREVADPQAQKIMAKGELLPAEVTNRLVRERLNREQDLRGIILDGYPRSIDQAEALVEYLRGRGGVGIEVVIVLDIGRDEILKRLAERGRSDDNDEAIIRRLDIFAEQGQIVLDYLTDSGARIEHVMANRTVGQVHDQIEEIIETL